VNDSGFSKFVRRRWFICLLLALVLAFNFTVRWRLRDMPLERDEGEYAYAGQLLLQGIPPYQLAYNMKFPGVYFAYALLMALFGQSAAGIHIGMIVVTSLTAILVFLIGCELFGEMGGVFAAATFVCLSALPRAEGLAGHATHFVSLFVCAGVLALLLARRKNSRSWWFWSGTLFGLAILIVQHAALFPAFILAWFFWKEFRRGNQPKPALIALLFCGGCLVPFLLMAFGFICMGLWGKFFFWTFQYASHYVSIMPLRSAPGQFTVGFDPVFESGMWVWFAGVVGMALLLRYREWKAPVELAALMFLAGLAAACPGFYFRNHYFIMAMPGLALLNAALVLIITRVLKNSGATQISIWLPLGLAIFILGDLVVNNWEIWFGATPMEASRQLYGISPYPESIPVADYLKSHSSPNDKIAVLGSEPELFFLSDRRSASGYLYIYSLTEPQPLAPQMRAQFTGEIEAARPKYVVFVNIFSSWYSVILPESLQSADAIQGWWGNYSTNYTLTGAVKIYADKPSQILWDEKLLNHPDTTKDDLLIFRRNP
jgi:hypothetical protein